VAGNLSGTAILDRLTAIIGSWPGEKTSVIDPKERHLRFVLAVAGYPEVASSTRPFDMPLSGKSTDCLSVSREMDNVVGMHHNTSLRSSILNNDLNLRSSGGIDDPGALKRSQRECLSLLFARLRQLDGVEDISDPTYRPQEEALLATLHSYDNNRRSQWWPNLAKMTKTESGDFSHIIGNATDPGEMPVEFRQDLTVSERESLENWKRGRESISKEKWLRKNGISDRFSYGVDGRTPLTFQFHHVQRWLRKNFPSSPNGQNQRFLRGASILLELVVSECRHRIARKVGIGSITADGGGRVSFLCPKDDVSKLRSILEKSVFEFLMILGTNKESGKEEGSIARNNVRFSTTIARWGHCCTLLGQGDGTDLTGGMSRKDARKWSEEIGSQLPPFSITTHEIKSEGSHDALTRLREKYEQGFPRIILKGSTNYRCSFCPDGRELDKPSSLSSRMGVSLPSIEELRKERICPFHRLMFLLGHDQRLRDSTLRVPGPGDATHQRIDTGGQRKVTSIARVDGNSLGIIFQERYEDDFDDGELHDRRRRRSFRFNTAWWSSLQKAVHEPGLGDRIAAWVTAGDDVVLAEYGLVEVDTRPAGRSLRTALESWARELSDVDELDDGMFLSFGAGLSTTRGRGGIQELMDSAGGCEEASKRRWKSMVDSESAGETHPMLMRRSGGNSAKVEWDPEEGWEGCIIEDSRSVLLADENTTTHEESDREYRVPDFPGWTPELVEAILKEEDLQSLGENERWDLLSRHFIEISNRRMSLRRRVRRVLKSVLGTADEEDEEKERTLVVLIPRRIGD